MKILDKETSSQKASLFNRDVQKRYQISLPKKNHNNKNRIPKMIPQLS